MLRLSPRSSVCGFPSHRFAWLQPNSRILTWLGLIAGRRRHALARYFFTRTHQPSLFLWDLLYALIAPVWFVLLVLLAVVWFVLVHSVWLTLGLLDVVSSAWLALRWSAHALRWAAQPRHALPLLMMLSLFAGSTPAAPKTIVVMASESWASLGFRLRSSRSHEPSQNPGTPPQPVKAPPIANLENIDEVRKHPPNPPQIPPLIPSTVRSRHNPLAPRNGKRVGDPGTTIGATGATRFGSGSGNDGINTEGGEIPRTRVRGVAARVNAFNAGSRGKLHHAAAKARATVAAPPIGDDQYVQNFFSYVLARLPYANEQSYWDDILRAAYAHGRGSMMIGARELGRTLFESAEYALRARSDRNYVYDLYETYLMRYPDQGGWDYWTGQVYWLGRAGVRRAFDESGEFAYWASTITPNGGASSAVASLLTARIDPQNQPGNGLLSRDAGWAVSLLGLPGRAGLDLGLGLSYSSAMSWTRSGPYIYFDQDNGWPSPGFRLGFPTIQEVFFDAQAGANAYLLITPAGQRVALRQIGASNIYEAADSSYLQLIDNGSSLLVRAPDGTQMTYAKVENEEWRCTQVKDSNGNFLTVNHNWLGHITNITDTLGRTMTFNYDPNANLLSITQTWTVNGVAQTHYWATFGWSTATISPSFPGVSVSGAANGEIIPVITQVGLEDGSRYNFQYNGVGQVSSITHYAYDGRQLTYTIYDYGAADDATRLADTQVWVDGWNMMGNGVPLYVVTQYSVNGDGSHQATVTGDPNGTVYKEYYGLGWQRGLTTRTEIWSGGALQPQKWTTTAWTQDNTSVSYQTNPRVTETNIYDAGGNHSRAVTGYYTFTLPSGASCSLPSDTYEYAADAVTVLRRMHTDYIADSAYLNQRLIGLPQGKYLYDGANNLFAKNTFLYDWASHLEAMPGGVNPVQHDSNYGTTFLTRGNLVDTVRFDTNDPNNINGTATESKLGYNTAGEVTFTRDHLWHQNFFSYADSFSDGNNSRNTFAYPTTATDADGFQSFVQYSFDFGAQTRVQGPPPAGQTQGLIQTFAYDGARRIQQITVSNTGAYTRYAYGPNYIWSYSTVNNVADEAWSIKYFDGVGRVIQAATNHPGSTGGYSGVLTYYNLQGLPMKQSNPTEITNSWVPAGDDAAGWYFSQQTYDWKGRPLVTTNTDNTQKSASYSGCGCAGGDVVTLTDEGTTLSDGTVKKRQQKIYSDVLGRASKTEVLNWDGAGSYGTGGTVYAATVKVYNARDQVTFVNEYQGPAASDGSCPSGTCQQTSMNYDGFGRLKTKHAPEQNAGAATTWNYNADDTVYSITDARGASATYGYNGRHLVTGITYAAPAGSGITVPAAMSYAYDAAGNRTSMGDGLGSANYNYDQLSRLTAETRYFSALWNSPTGGNYTINYQYNLAGGLTRISDPFNVQINYARDTAGRVTGVTGSPFAGVTQYATSITYRAWGGQKSVSYGDNSSATTNYTARMQPSAYTITSPPDSNGTVWVNMREQFQYYPDGRLQQMTDLDDTATSGYPSSRHFSRAYSYDHAGRTTAAGGVPSPSQSLPFSQSYAYNAFNNLTSRAGSYYYQPYSSDGGTFQNNRRQDWTYDADGGVVHNPPYGSGTAQTFRDWQYNADGQVIWVRDTKTADSSTSTYTASYNGDGQTGFESTQQSSGVTTEYVLRSSVLTGQELTRLDSGGNKKKTLVLVDDLLVATQYASPSASILWIHTDPLGLSIASSAWSSFLGAGNSKPTYDPLGNYIPFQDVPQSPSGPFSPAWGGLGVGFGFFMNSSATTCTLDGLPYDCDKAMHMLVVGSAEQCPNNYCGPDRVRDPATGQIRLVPLTRNPATGQLGYYAPKPAKPKPTLKPAMRPNPDPGNPNPNGTGKDEGKSDPQNQQPTPTPDPCANLILTEFSLRDESRTVPILPYIQTSVAQDFQEALDEINKAVPEGIGFTEVFRTRERQQDLWNNRANNPNPVARPGTSRHEGGFAFDVPGIATGNRQGQLVPTELGDIVIPIFKRHGFAWGGAFNDPPHFQADFRRGGYRSSTEAATAANAYYERCIRGRE